MTEAYNKLVKLNPFGYRGYALDNECNLYYLISRYYASETIRFMNPDTVVGVIGSITQQNLFVYSSNMPVVFGDSNGKFLCTLIGAVTGAISGLVTALRTDDDIAACVVAGAAEGAITGMTMDLAATGAGAPISTVLVMGGIGAATGEMVYQSIKYGGVVDYGDVIVSGAMGALTEGITFGIGTYLDKHFKAFSKASDKLFNESRKLAEEGFEEAAEMLFEATIKANRNGFLFTKSMKILLPKVVNKTTDRLTEEMKERFDAATREIMNMTPIERILADLESRS